MLAFGEKTVEGVSGNVGGIDLNANMLNIDRTALNSKLKKLNINFKDKGTI